MVDIDNDTLYKAVKDAVSEIISKEITTQQLEHGYSWIYKAINEGTREAMEKNKK